MNNNLNHYHKDSRLLFQFILSEYLRIYDVLQSEADLEHIVHQLAGSASPSTRIFSATFDDSLLAKLKSYCNYITHDDEIPQKERDSLKKISYELWELGLECQEKMEQEEPIKPLLKKIEKLLGQMGTTILLFIKHYADDENILFFILRNQDQWNAIFGKKATTELFETHYTQLSKAKQHLNRAYRKRNFDPLVPIIENHFATLNS